MERIELDPRKNYLQPGEEPFFIVDKNTKEAHILRPANFDPVGEAK